MNIKTKATAPSMDDMVATVTKLTAEFITKNGLEPNIILVPFPTPGRSISMQGMQILWADIDDIRVAHIGGCPS